MPSRSMEPTIPEQAIFFVSAWPYWHSEPEVGDAVVFRYPGDRSIEYAQRIVAAGGLQVEITDGVLRIDGRVSEEPYIHHVPPTGGPAGSCFVLGDNRNNSEDSRAWGFLPRTDIIGRAHVAR